MKGCLKVAVLAGGTSTERDVSIVTGSRVCAALRRKGHSAQMIDVFFGTDKTYENLNDFFEENTDLKEQESVFKGKTIAVKREEQRRRSLKEGFFGPGVLDVCKAADIVFIALHGANGEDGKIQATFDLMGIQYTGTGYLSSAISMNKSITKLLMTGRGIPMPKGISVHFCGGECSDFMYREIIQKIGFPCVIKPCCGGSSVGVSVVFAEEQLAEALKQGFALEQELLAEEYIKGREFSVGILDGKALPVIEMAPLQGFYDYKNKYIPGMTKDTCPADLPPEISRKMQEYAECAADVLRLETYGRMDCLLREDGSIYCLEMNTLPGMTDTSLIPQEAQATGMGYDDLCEFIIDCSFRKYDRGGNQA